MCLFPQCEGVVAVWWACCSERKTREEPGGGRNLFVVVLRIRRVSNYLTAVFLVIFFFNHQAATSSSQYCVPASLLPTCLHVADSWKWRCSRRNPPASPSPFFSFCLWCLHVSPQMFASLQYAIDGEDFLMSSVWILGNVVVCWDIWVF